MDRELINKSKEILDRNILDIQEQETLNEISLGKLSNTVFIGRLKVLTNKIKDKIIRKSFMTLGYMIYTVSLQSKSIKNIEDNLSKLNQQLQKQIQQQNIEKQKLNTNK